VRHRTLLLILFLLPSLLFASGPRGGVRTSVRLIADVASAAPGGAFTVGVVLTMEPGWHTYWENPGEAGIPTSVEWSTPPGFATGGILWPVPEKYVEAGNILTYGYAGETMLMVPVTVPAGAVPGTAATLSAKVSWLECEHTCVPGEAQVSLTMPISALTGPATHAEMFARYRAVLPTAASPDSPVRVTTRATANSAEIRITPARALAGKTGDFYPVPAADLQAGRTTMLAEGDTVVLTVPFPQGLPLRAPPSLRGVLLYTLAPGGERKETLEIPLPAAVSSGTSLLDRNFGASAATQGAPALPLIFLFAVLGGLLLNIMPCVLPVIALKIFGLVNMAGDRPEKITRLGRAFSAGILFSFLLLAILVIILQFAGEQVGWGFQFQEPLFVIAMAAIVFAFGLSLFGVYEIQIPGAALSGINAALVRKEGKGYGASFAEGIFATILATPCTAPFLGSALGFAFTQPWWMILAIFSSVAVGMALPYLVLTARPAWLRYLPKPGPWMEAAKQFMGFLMMATLLWLLYILGRQLGMEAVIWTGAFLLSVGVACWIIGRFATLVASRRTYRLAWIVALLVAAGGYLLFMESALDVRGVIAGLGTVGRTAEGTGIRWTPLTVAGLEEDLRGDRIVFVDFTAEWCLTCKVNEKTVLAAGPVIDAFEKSGVIAVRADWTNRNPDITRLLAKFSRSGVPLYVVFPPGRRDAPIVLPEVITEGIVLDALAAASQGASVAP
jgi:thiol:disulfide interchange protein/DsbC/DsbD-like thiol-disulfide interchange protein